MTQFDRLTSELTARREAILASVLDQARVALPDWTARNVFLWEEVVEFARSSLAAELDGFRRDTLPDRCPSVDAAGAQAAARVGELRGLLRAYRSTQMALSEAWLDLVESSVPDPDERGALLRRGSDYFFRYAGLLGDFVADVYQAELERATRSGEQRRFQAVRGLLDGDPLVDADLGIDLEQFHLGFVVWGEGGDARARDLATALGRPILILATLNRSWWGWLSASRPLNYDEERELRRLSFEPGTGAGIALGLEAYGEPGFCATHRQALRARWVARKTDRPVVSYADVAVEALASDNQADARAFVAHELRGIEDDSAVSQRLRETLSAYFAAEHNAASAAAALGIHQQTVANRLRAAEERLGHPVGARRVELEVALRLRASLTREDS